MSGADPTTPCGVRPDPVPGRTETGFVTDLMADMRGKVASYLARTGMPEEDFGKLALGRPDFVERLGVQRSMTLNTADRLLRFMGEAPIGPAFRREVEAFLDVTGLRPARFGIDTAGVPDFVDIIRTRGTVRLRRVDLVRAHMRRIADSSQRTVIAGMLQDGGQSSSVVAARPVPQRGSESGEASGASAADTDTGGPPRDRRREFLDTGEAAALLGISGWTLSKYRRGGAGPAYHRYGRKIVYAYTDLLSWALAKRQTTGESD